MTPVDCVLIRADAGPEIGIGHIVRCRALGQAWLDAHVRSGRSSARVVVASAQLPEHAEQWLRQDGAEVVRLNVRAGSLEDARQAAALARDRRASWVIVDGVHFNFEYQCALRSSGAKQMVVDDGIVDGRFDADVLLNQNLLADAARYAGRAPGAKLLLGPEYILLRHEFLKWKSWAREFPESAERVLITIGGGDPDGLTGHLLQVLARIRQMTFHVHVVMGPANPRRAETENIARQSFPPDGAMRVELVDSTENMPGLMAWADFAVILAGITLWETLFMGCPVISFSRNPVQAVILRHLDKSGAACYAGKVSGFDEQALVSTLHALGGSAERRRAMAEKGRALVDGEGARRIVRVLQGGARIS